MHAQLALIYAGINMGQCSMNLGCIIYAILSNIVYIMCKSLNHYSGCYKVIRLQVIVNNSL